MPGHENQVEAPSRPVSLRRRLDPLNAFRPGLSPGNIEHSPCRINSRYPVTAFCQGTAECTCATTQVQDTTGLPSGKREIEVGSLVPVVGEVIHDSDLGVLIIHGWAMHRQPPTFYFGRIRFCVVIFCF